MRRSAALFMFICFQSALPVSVTVVSAASGECPSSQHQWKTHPMKDGAREEGCQIGTQRDGPWQTYWPNGKLKSQGFYKKGLKEGSWATFYANGKVHQESFYECGEPSGTWKVWKETGGEPTVEIYDDRACLFAKYDKLFSPLRLIQFSVAGVTGFQDSGGQANSLEVAWRPRYEFSERLEAEFQLGFSGFKRRTTDSVFVVARYTIHVNWNARATGPFYLSAGIGGTTWFGDGTYLTAALSGGPQFQRFLIHRIFLSYEPVLAFSNLTHLIKLGATLAF